MVPCADDRELWACCSSPQNWQFYVKLVLDSSNSCLSLAESVVKDNNKYRIEMLFIVVLQIKLLLAEWSWSMAGSRHSLSSVNTLWFCSRAAIVSILITAGLLLA